MSSPLSFGVLQYGGRADTAPVMAMLDACYDATLRHVEPAWVYTSRAPDYPRGRFDQSSAEQLAPRLDPIHYLMVAQICARTAALSPSPPPTDQTEDP